MPNLFPQTIGIERATPSNDTMGGEKRPTWTMLDGLTGIAASIQQQFGGVVDLFARRGVKITHSIFTRTDVSATQIGDRVTDQDANQYTVRLPVDMAGRGKVWELFVEQLV